MQNRLDDSAGRIAEALTRLRPALAARPTLGTATAVSVSTLSDGVRCVTHEHGWTIDTDLARGLGGDAAAPSPTALVRAALGACLAMSYRLRAAETGVALDAVRVTVETDSDVRGLLGISPTTPAGFTALRYLVEIDSPASADVVRGLIDDGDRHSPVLDVLAGACPTQRSVVLGPIARSSTGMEP